MTNLLEVRLETPRLVLRPVHTGDAHAVERLFSPEVAEQLSESATKKLSAPAALLRLARRQLVENTEWHAAIEEKGGQFVGLCALRAANTPTPELGIWLGQQFWGRGYAKESVARVCAWARSDRLVEYFRFETFADNHGGLGLARSLRGIAQGSQQRLRDGTGRVRATELFQLL